MILTKEEERMLKGKFGRGVQKSMEILGSLGEIFGAQRMIEVGSVHLPGTGVISATDSGIEFVKEMAQSGARFRTWTTVNTCSADFSNWKQIGLSKKSVQKQFKLSEYFRRMGSVGDHTCTPYFGLSLPRTNEHIAWGESTAVLLANSVFGARTNREGGPSALAAAITGRAAFGLHIKRNRAGDSLFHVKARLNNLADFSALGYHVGKVVNKGIPVCSNLSPKIYFDELKALTSLIARGGNIALFHIIGITPEARTIEEVFPKGKPKNPMIIDDEDLRKTFEELNTAGKNDPGLIVLGCPHASIREIVQISTLLERKKVCINNELWIFTSLAVKSMADRMGCTDVIERAGGLIITDTCPNLVPDEAFLNRNVNCVTSDSAVMINALSVYHGNLGLQRHFGNTEKCVNAAISGKWEEV